MRLVITDGRWAMPVGDRDTRVYRLYRWQERVAKILLAAIAIVCSV